MAEAMRVTTTTIDTRASDWYARQLAAMGKPSELSEGHKRCLNVLGQICNGPGSLYNLPSVGPVTDAIALWPTGGLSALIHTELATFDFDALTRLVVAAHRFHVRAAVSPWFAHQDETRSRLIAAWMTREYEYDIEWDDPKVAAGVMEVTCHPRAPEGRGFERHPSATDLAAILAEEL